MFSLSFLRSFSMLVGGLFATAVWATPGDPDLSFGGTGRVVTNLVMNPQKLVIFPDGKMLTLGSAGAGLVIARWNIDGTPDTTFNGTGSVTAPNVVENYDSTVQSDGKVVAVGKLNSGLAVARYNPDGTLDTSFNGTGSRSVRANAFGTNVVVQPNGKIVAAGGEEPEFGKRQILVARFNSNGTLDTHFNSKGYISIPFGNFADCASLALQSDGKILIGGRDNLSQLTVIRLLASGKLDTSWHGTGKLQITDGVTGSAVALAVQGDGKVLATGFGGDPSNIRPVSIFRFTSNGAADSTFGENGVVSFTKTRPIYHGPTLIDGSGKIVIGAAFVLARFDPDGAPDTGFAGDGFQTDLFRGVFRIGLFDGKIIVAEQDDDQHLVFERYLGADPPLTVATLPATNVIAHEATLQGAVNPMGETGVAAYFEWGLSPTAMTNATPPVAVGNGTMPVPVQATISGLERTTLYYYRLRTTPFVTNIGEVRNLVTVSDVPPGIVSKTASGLVAGGATLNAAVNPNNQATTAYFEWGVTTGYGQQTPTMNVATGITPVAINATITGLTTDQTYHFRAVATNQAGTSLGADRTFAPSAGAPQPQDDVILIDGDTTIHPLTNDTDPNGDPLTIVGLDPDAMPDPASGTAQPLGNLIFYKPTPGMLRDEFGYIVQDATGKTAKARVRAYRLSEIRGQYFGVLSQVEGTGKLSVELGVSGAFSLLLTWLGEDYAVKGRIESDGSFQAVLTGKGMESGALLLLQLQYDPASGQIDAQLTDSVVGGPFTFPAPLGGETDEALSVVSNTLYTTTIDVPENAALPENAEAASGFTAYRGSGFASVKIAKNRSARFIGQMPDTAKFSAGSPVARRTYAFYSALYRVKRGALGSVSGNATLQSDFELRGDSLRWQRDADSRDNIFSGSFSTPAFLNGDRYTPPTRGQLLQIGLELLAGAFSNANLDMTLGGLNPDVRQALKFIPGSVRVVGENPSKVKLKISPKTGTFSGSFLHDASNATTKFSGIFITSPFQIREGRGSFRGVGAGGKVRIARP
jgi:uncharacterized delta-60 repeat protein